MKTPALKVAEWLGDRTVMWYFSHNWWSYVALRLQNVILRHYKVWPFNHTIYEGDM
jgi:hypothetical protein